MRLVLTVLLLLVVSGCRDEEAGYLDTAAVRAAAREAGFEDIRVHSNAAALKESAELFENPSLAESPLDIDVVYVKTFLPGSPLAAVRHPSVESAEVADEFRAEDLTEEQLELVREVAPGFDPATARAFRACNVVVDSYDDGSIDRLRERVDRFVTLLRLRCRSE
jgi:hypothetical protein